jgi:hypothetical protein
VNDQVTHLELKQISQQFGFEQMIEEQMRLKRAGESLKIAEDAEEKEQVDKEMQEL